MKGLCPRVTEVRMQHTSLTVTKMIANNLAVSYTFFNLNRFRAVVLYSSSTNAAHILLAKHIP